MNRYHATATNYDDDVIDIGLFRSRAEAVQRFRALKDIDYRRWELSVRKVKVVKETRLVIKGSRQVLAVAREL